MFPSSNSYLIRVIFLPVVHKLRMHVFIFFFVLGLCRDKYSDYLIPSRRSGGLDRLALSRVSHINAAAAPTRTLQTVFIIFLEKRTNLSIILIRILFLIRKVSHFFLFLFHDHWNADGSCGGTQNTNNCAWVVQGRSFGSQRARTELDPT